MLVLATTFVVINGGVGEVLASTQELGIPATAVMVAGATVIIRCNKRSTYLLAVLPPPLLSWLLEAMVVATIVVIIARADCGAAFVSTPQVYKKALLAVLLQPVVIIFRTLRVI